MFSMLFMRADQCTILCRILSTVIYKVSVMFRYCVKFILNKSKPLISAYVKALFSFSFFFFSSFFSLFFSFLSPFSLPLFSPLFSPFPLPFLSFFLSFNRNYQINKRRELSHVMGHGLISICSKLAILWLTVFVGYQ